MARTDDLVIEQVDKEILLYDERNGQAHCLSAVAAQVWRACDGRTPVDRLSSLLGLDEDTLARALGELDACGLLASGPAGSHGLTRREAHGLTRREAASRMAKAGAVAASAPLIYSIVAPTPALAASQNYCLGLRCQGSCSTCYSNGCACCGDGTSGKYVCTADCSSTNCKVSIVHDTCSGCRGSQSRCSTR
jgi:hypothetical protein